ncbi:MAG TPA: DUF6279 family lipoprotein [Polyangiaceae bacterium]|nr:DUF6279 family lipoprotein [Polyangiaceae bacterium]
MKSALKLTAALAAAAWLLAGCTALRLAYDNADTYLLFRAKSYLDLDAKGSDELDERIDEFFAWHRRTALPQYARLSEEAAKRVAHGLSREDLVWGYDSLVAHARQSLRFAAERVAPLLDRLTPQQVAHMEKRFAEDNRKFAREYLHGSEAERRKRRARRLEERLEDWVGNLSSVQAEKVRQFSERTPLYDELRAKDRQRMQAEFVDMIRKRQAQKHLPDWIANWERGRDPAHLAASERFRQEYLALLLELDKTLAPEQRNRAAANLRRYAEDFRVLARRARAGPSGK